LVVRLPLSAGAEPKIIELEPTDAGSTSRHADRRRIACGAASFVDEGTMVAVPIIPSFEIVDEQIGRLVVRGAVLARRDGRLYAYANLCRHIPLALDMGDGEVAAADRRHFLCHHHGARYRIEDGTCASGPCDGEALVKIEHEVIDGELFLVLPPPP
jgi:nitrite reductase/ring-hydroxylating ferredoxin subunit